MITLVVEDGTGKPNSNTYADVAYARVIAEQMGYALPADDAELSSLLLQAMPFIDWQCYGGQRAVPGQALAWPRKYTTYDGTDVPSNIVPDQVKRAQIAAVNLITLGTNLYPTTDGQFTTKEKVGPIEVEYSDEFLATWNGQPMFAAVMAYLGGFCNGGAGGYRLSRKFGF